MAKVWLLIENDYTGDREPDGHGGWVDQVITRVLAGTEDASAVNAVLEALKRYQEMLEKTNRPRAAQTLIRTDAVSVPQVVLDVAEGDAVEDLLKKIKV